MGVSLQPGLELGCGPRAQPIEELLAGFRSRRVAGVLDRSVRACESARPPGCGQYRPARATTILGPDHNHLQNARQPGTSPGPRRRYLPSEDPSASQRDSRPYDNTHRKAQATHRSCLRAILERSPVVAVRPSTIASVATRQPSRADRLVQDVLLPQKASVRVTLYEQASNHSFAQPASHVSPSSEKS